MLKMVKKFHKPDYNYSFDMVSGAHYRWGKTVKDDPSWCPYGPEILDIEIASGHCNGACPWCYKGNSISKYNEYMPFDLYTKVFSKLNLETLTQIAFGITSISANPDMWKIMEFTRSNGIIPNYTTNGIQTTDRIADLTKELCGAVAVSVYPHTKKVAYEAIRKYLDHGVGQVNMHFMLSEETLPFLYEVLEDIKNKHPLIDGMNAIVLLQYKDKNPNAHFHSPSFLKFKEVVDYCYNEKINFGFDSCSSAMFMKSVASYPDAERLISMVDNCESSLMSFYIDYKGLAYPCSFLQGIGEWEKGINVATCSSFMDDVWFNPRVVAYREKLLSSSKGCSCKFSNVCRSCFVYDINKCKG